MSQFPQPPSAGYYDPNMMSQEPARKSGLAITALVMSLIGIIPCLGLITAPLGVLLGLIGVVAIKPPKTGKGMAGVAVLLGILFTGAQAYLGKKYVIDPIRGYFEFAMNGPNDTLSKGFAGDIAGFKADFVGSGASASDAEAKAFIEELRRRYGSLTSVTLPQNQQGKVTQPQPGQPAFPLPYTFSFANKTLDGEAELVFADQTANTLIKKLGYIKIVDAENGDIVYPSGAAGGSTQPTPAAPSGDGGAAASGGTIELPPPATSPNG